MTIIWYQFSNCVIISPDCCQTIGKHERAVCVKLTGPVNQCKYFSIALDESTDVADISQLLVFAKIVDSKFVAREELLDIVPLNFNT